MSDIAPITRLTEFLERLSQVRINFTIGYYRENSLMVTVAVPGERWEVEFFTNGDVEIERFVATGRIEDERALDNLFNKFTDRTD